MKQGYHQPGVFACPWSAGPFSLYETAQQPMFLGYMQSADGCSQPMYSFPQAGKYYPNNTYSGHIQGTNYDTLCQSLSNISLQSNSREYLPPTSRRSVQPSASQRPNSSKAVKPPKGFFSIGRGDTANWRARISPAATRDVDNSNKENSDNVRRTIYITDVDQQITEEQLAVFFKDCGEVTDCRVCGDPNSAMRFGFIEFSTEQAASAALEWNGCVLGGFPLRILPSKTAIVPVNNQFLPKTTAEREQCIRTVYAANIDKKVDRESVKLFFETLCGPVAKFRLLGDWMHTTRIAFVEFVQAESAKNALSCSGALLGSLPIRVSPSKTPVRDEPLGQLNVKVEPNF